MEREPRKARRRWIALGIGAVAVALVLLLLLWVIPTLTTVNVGSCLATTSFTGHRPSNSSDPIVSGSCRVGGGGGTRTQGGGTVFSQVTVYVGYACEEGQYPSTCISNFTVESITVAGSFVLLSTDPSTPYFQSTQPPGGASVTISVTASAPSSAGSYNEYFDVVVE